MAWPLEAHEVTWELPRAHSLRPLRAKLRHTRPHYCAEIITAALGGGGARAQELQSHLLKATTKRWAVAPATRT
jgi:hypothetical protein